MTIRAVPVTPTLVLALLLVGTSALAAGDPSAALDHLEATRDGDGHFATSPRYVLEAAHSAGQDVTAWPAAGGPTVWDQLEPTPTAECPTEGEAYFANLRQVHAVGTSGRDPHDVHGVNLVRCLNNGFDGNQHGDPLLINDDAWAILALRAADYGRGNDRIQASADVLVVGQNLDGGWSHNGLAASDTDFTAMVLVALDHAGRLDDVATSAADFLASTSAASGGHSSRPGEPANCQSTVWAIHAANVLGQAVDQADLDFLASLQNPDGGYAVAPGLASDPFCTAEAVPVAAGRYQPWSHGEREPTGGGGGGEPGPFKPYRELVEGLTGIDPADLGPL
ncbi:MAG: hypothetical protein ACPGQL_10510 [Thermoplasmatota archaeon]